MIEIINYISKMLAKLPYAYMEWTDEPKYPYIIGEYSEIENSNEDGLIEATFILTITGKDTWLELEKIREQIKKIFPPIEGGINGEGIVIYYENSVPIFTGTEEYKRLQINLKAKKWGNKSW